MSKSSVSGYMKPSGLVYPSMPHENCTKIKLHPRDPEWASSEILPVISASINPGVWRQSLLTDGAFAFLEALLSNHGSSQMEVKEQSTRRKSKLDSGTSYTASKSQQVTPATENESAADDTYLLVEQLDQQCFTERMVFFLSPSHCLVAFLLLVVLLLVGPVLSQSAIMGADPPYVHQDVHLGLPEHDHRNGWWVVFSQWNSARQCQVNTPVQPFWQSNHHDQGQKESSVLPIESRWRHYDHSLRDTGPDQPRRNVG
ncbi:hypothetical protein EV360DRAFT_70587 [Lentinula raphanica]|nr:hypothetical protein EV360DRAFT_70587 [Lentinula raphanica]